MADIEMFWVCLIGLWLTHGLAAFAIASSKLHWFLKLALLAGLAGLMTFIEAPDLRVIALLQGWTIFFMIAAGKLRQSQKQPTADAASQSLFLGKPTLSLLDAMLSVAVFAVLVAACSADFSDYFPLEYSALFGALLGLTPASALWLAKCKHGWCVVLSCIGCVVGGILIPKIIFRPTKGFLAGLLGREFIWSTGTDFVVGALIANAIAWFSLGLLWRLSRSESFYLKNAARVLGLIAIAGAVVLSIATIHVYVSLLSGPAVAWPAQPDDDLINGYDELVAVAQKFGSSEILEDTDLAAGGAMLAQEIAAYSREFEVVEQALQRDRLTAEMTRIDQFDRLIDDAPKLRAIARALTCRAIQFVHEDNADLALNDLCLMAKLSVPLRRAKTIFTELLAIALEGMAHWQAVEVIPNASSESLRVTLHRFADIAPEADHSEEFLANDIAVMWAYITWQGRLASIAGQENFVGIKNNIMNAVKRRDSTRRQVVTLIAIELYQRQNERYPQELAQLVPDFLEAVPIDPFSSAGNSPLVYRLSSTGDSFELYCFGRDGDDDQGKLDSTGFAYEDGDLNLRAIVRYENATTDAQRNALTIPDPYAIEESEYTEDELKILDATFGE